MDNEWLVTGMSILGILAGLGLLIYGEAAHDAKMFIWIGGAIILLGFSGQVAMIASLEDEEPEAPEL